MRIQLDTKLKTIKVEESMVLGELVDSLEKLLPNGLWKEFKLETSTVINWGNPIIIKDYPYSYYPWWNPYTPTTVMYDTNISSYELNPGTYSIQI